MFPEAAPSLIAPEVKPVNSANQTIDSKWAVRAGKCNSVNLFDTSRDANCSIIISPDIAKYFPIELQSLSHPVDCRHQSYLASEHDMFAYDANFSHKKAKSDKICKGHCNLGNCNSHSYEVSSSPVSESTSSSSSTVSGLQANHRSINGNSNSNSNSSSLSNISSSSTSSSNWENSINSMSPGHFIGYSSGMVAVGSQVSPSSRPIKICGVCGDRAKSYHFGGISCDSCKAFFRRSVQNDAYGNFSCPFESNCEITIVRRKCCQFCRFQKCIQIGMEKSWVMTEEERLQMLRSRMEKKAKSGQDCYLFSKRSSCSSLIGRETDANGRHHQHSHSREHEPDINRISYYLSDRDVALLESFIQHYLSCCCEITLRDEYEMTLEQSNQRSKPIRTIIIEIFFTVIRQFTQFTQRLKSFKQLTSSDQKILLRSGVLELCFVRGSYHFDIDSGCWPLGKAESPTSYLASNDLASMLSKDLFDKTMNFIRLIKDLDIDEITMILFSGIVLFNPDRPGLHDVEIISTEQEKYIILLRNYLNWRLSEDCAASLFPKLLLILPELRELSEASTDFNLFLGQDEIEQVQQRLVNITLNASSSSSSSSSPSLSSPSSSSSETLTVKPSNCPIVDTLSSPFEFTWSLKGDMLNFLNSQSSSSFYHPHHPSKHQTSSSYCDEDYSTSSESSDKHFLSD